MISLFWPRAFLATAVRLAALGTAIPVALPVAAVALGTACTPDAPGSSAGDAVPRWTLSPVPVVVIGEGREDDPAYLFDQVRSISITGDDRLVVSDFGLASLRVYRMDGTFERRLGVRGEGPGELGGIAASWLVEPDTVRVYDHRLVRFVSFLLDGTHVGTVPLEPAGRPGHLAGALPDGSVVLGWASFGSGEVGAAADRIVADRMTYARWGADGAFFGAFAEISGMWRYAPEDVPGPVPVPGIHPFSPFPHPVVRGGEVLYTNGVEGEVTVFTPEGEVVDTIDVPMEAPSVDEARSALARVLRERDRADVLEEVPAADRIPSVAELLVDDRGRLWAQRYEADEDSSWLGSWRLRGGGEWLVLDRAGELLATVRMPDDFTPKTIRGSLVAGVVKDDFDVQRVAVHRLEESPG